MSKIMIKLLIIDSNNILEDHTSFLKQLPEMRSFVSKKLIIEGMVENIDILNRFTKDYNNENGDFHWEYYPIFWRSFLNFIGIKKNISNTLSWLFDVFIEYYSEHIKLYEDALHLLDQVSGTVSFALLANGNEKRINAFIDKYKLDHIFERIVISGETPFKKPDSILFKYLLNEFSVKPNEVLMVGDRLDNDIAGANSLGIYTAHIDRQGITKYPSSGPWCTPFIQLQDLSQIPKVINVLNSKSHNNSILASSLISPKTAFILCGGVGKRMGTIDGTTNKVFLLVDEISVVERNVKLFLSAGCTYINIIIKKEQKEFSILKEKYSSNTINIMLYITQKNSTSEALLEAAKSTKLSSSFFYCHGNILFPPVLLQKIILSYNLNNDSNILSVTNYKNNITHARIVFNENNIINEVILPDHFKKNNESLFIGLAIYNQDLLEIIEKNRISGMTESAIKILNEHRNIHIVNYDGNWVHLENPDDYKHTKDKAIVDLLY